MMNDGTIYVGLDVHKDSTAVAVSEPGGQSRFIGTVGPQWQELLKVLELGAVAILYKAFGQNASHGTTASYYVPVLV